MSQIANGKECEKCLMYLTSAVRKALDARTKKESDVILSNATISVQAHLITTTA